MQIDPSGWQPVTLGEMVQEISIHERAPEKQGIDRYVGLEHLDSQDLRVRRWGLLSEGVTFTKVFRAGQVLFGKRRVYQKKVGVPDFDGLCSGDIIVLATKSEQLLPEFLPLVIQSDAFFAYAEKTSSGSLSPRTKFRELAKFEFLLPPPKQQRELVELLLGVDGAIEASVLTEQAARELFLALGAREMTPPPGSTLISLDQVADIVGGKQLSPSQATGDNMVPYLRAANIRLGWIDFDDVNQMNFEPREQQRLTVHPGDTLLMEGNANPAYVGTPALFSAAMPRGFCIQNTVIRLRPTDPARLLPDYLYIAMRHFFESGKFKELASGSSIKHLGSTRVARLMVHLPLPHEQAHTVSLLKAASETADQTAQHLAHLRTLRAALLNTALSPAPAAVTAPAPALVSA
ncbi:restriction endonuclease subunit S [Deinococcus sp. NW-56]|uniref:restriction endonuclease subunit S n=1 Tax=Deinococcus sp. NW-56 TaxID=2080419 RepID=UPI001319D5E7|nr:restriction endonuclease subunit S [Deinococcus sp. NW-56]